MATVSEILKDTGDIPRSEAVLLLSFVLKKDQTFLLAHPEASVSPAHARVFTKFLTRRAAHEPIAYIFGEKEFFGLSFRVNRHTLIPRPETELLVEHVLAAIGEKSEQQAASKHIIADIGTGSGAIALSIAHTLSSQQASDENIILYATDISAPALRMAKKNAKRHQLKKPIAFLHGSLLSPLLPFVHKEDSLILVANLPYLSQKLYQSTEPDIRHYEPQSALLSEQDGLAHYFSLLESIEKNKKSLPDEIDLFLEISPEQKEKLVLFIYQKFPRSSTACVQDLAGIDRVIEAHIKLS